MTTQGNLRTSVTAWMRHRPCLVEAVAAVLGCGLGAVLCGTLGLWFIGLQAGLGLAVIGAAVGLGIGFFSAQLAMAAVGLLLMIVLPSQRIYLAVAGILGAVGGVVGGQQLGYSSIEVLFAAIVYAILTLIICEICGAICTFFQRGNVRVECQSESEDA